MAIINANVTSKFQGIITVPLFAPPWNPVNVSGQFTAGSLFANLTTMTPGAQLSANIVTAFYSQLLTPLTKTTTRKATTPSNGTGAVGHAYFANRIIPVVNNHSSTSKPLILPIAPVFFTVTDLPLATVPPNYIAYNPASPISGFPSGLGALLAANGNAMVFYDALQNKFVAGHHWRRSSTGNSVLTIYPANARAEAHAPPWTFNQNPADSYCNVPDPLGVGNCMAISLPGVNGVFVCAIFRTFASDELKVTVSWDDATLQTALQNSTVVPQATAYGMLVGSNVDWQDQGATWVLMSPDCTKYYRIRFTNGGGLADISTQIANNYIPKIDMLGAWYVGRSNTFNVYTSSALALPSLQVPTGGIVPFSLPCWTPCIPPQFLG